MIWIVLITWFYGIYVLVKTRRSKAFGTTNDATKTSADVSHFKINTELEHHPIFRKHKDPEAYFHIVFSTDCSFFQGIEYNVP